MRGRLSGKNQYDAKGSLTVRQARFCRLYVKYNDEFKAYKKAGYKGNGYAAYYARRLLKLPQVQRYIDELTGASPALEDIDELTDRQARFVIEYLQDFNESRAAKRAGYKGSVALLNTPKVKAALKNIIRRRFRFLQLTQSDLLTQLARIITFDPRELFDINGELRNIRNLDDDTVAAIEGVDVNINKLGGKKSKGYSEVKSIKVASKIKAIELYGRYLSMWQDNLNVRAQMAVAGVMQVPGMADGVEFWKKIVKQQDQLVSNMMNKQSGVAGELGNDTVIDVEKTSKE